MARAGILVLAGFCGLLGLLLEYGVGVGAPRRWIVQALTLASVLFFLFELVWAGTVLRPWRRFIARRWPALLLTFLLASELVVIAFGGGSRWFGSVLRSISIGSVTQAYLIVVHFYILGLLAVQLPHLHSRFASSRVRPALAFPLVFLGIILVGSLLLVLPRAAADGQPLRWLDALFTSTSAVCVTGLVVRDTATGFSVFGQTILLILIQIGGLGIMSLTATFSMLLGRGIGVRENSLLREVFQVPLWDEVGRMLRFIVLFTVIAEALGTALLYLGLEPMIPAAGERLHCALFHAVSAFCNAGFSTFSASLVPVADSPLVMGSIAALLIVGGLGFTVVANLLAFARGWMLRRDGVRPRLMLQTRIVLSLTALLLVTGTFALLGLEGDGAFAGRSSLQQLGLAFFQSATTRTAGFNSVDMSLLSTPSLFLMIVLMFIGAAPGSTGGGVKLTTVAILWANLRSIASGLRRVRLLDREISRTAVQRAIIVAYAGMVIAAISVFVLLITEGRPLLMTAFEVFSALGTVGLSLGMTSELSPVGRLLIMVLMFIGRLGPLTLAYGLVGPARERRVRLPRAKIMIG